MQTSSKGVTKLEHDEGVVLKAYRCPAGVWTIGAGLTAGSGVVRPHAGMVITHAEATRLLQQALRQNYEPRVKRAMTGAKQHEFDAGVSFDYNTGAIHRATWVVRWRDKASGVREAMLAWNKGGGKVLPGLTRRREGEYRLLAHGEYGTLAQWQQAPGVARIVIDLSSDELAAARDALKSLGYAVGDNSAGFAEAAIRDFQRDHDLTVDGIVGRATLSALQRVIDSRRKAASAAVPAAAGGAETGTDAIASAADLPGVALVGPVLLGLGAIWLAWLAWQYRDTLAAAINPYLPRLARKLWSL
ncbi:glycoside hydrolase family protein [Pararhodobacter sp.]|uniref:glycoside hydrolase family protein n=1 Tax=Pararhodobacter sp. TaxID=2127056 RepID=UPI002FDCBA0E